MDYSLRSPAARNILISMYMAHELLHDWRESSPPSLGNGQDHADALARLGPTKTLCDHIEKDGLLRTIKNRPKDAWRAYKDFEPALRNVLSDSPQETAVSCFSYGNRVVVARLRRLYCDTKYATQRTHGCEYALAALRYSENASISDPFDVPLQEIAVLCQDMSSLVKSIPGNLERLAADRKADRSAIGSYMDSRANPSLEERRRFHHREAVRDRQEMHEIWMMNHILGERRCSCCSPGYLKIFQNIQRDFELMAHRWMMQRFDPIEEEHQQISEQDAAPG